ncbi:hypothetical protein BGZ83_005551, partial [Gryganskiella cystojenkinii]
WTERETTVSDRWTYEVKTYETFEEIEEVEEVVDESEITSQVVRTEKAVEGEKKIEVETSTTSTVEQISVDHVTKAETIVVEKQQPEIKETVIIKESAVAKPAVSKGSSWFRRLATGVAAGAGVVAVGAGLAAA